jgi:hypothetical protein
VPEVLEVVDKVHQPELLLLTEQLTQEAEEAAGVEGLLPQMALMAVLEL